MRVPTFSETAAASRNALLTAKLSKTLRVIVRGGSLGEHDTQAIARGAALLNRIIQGSLTLDQRNEGGLSPSAAGLQEYGKALSAIRMLNNPTLRGQDTTDLLLRYRDRLLLLSSTGQMDANDASELDQFFSSLNSVFYAEVQQPITATREEPIAKRR